MACESTAGPNRACPPHFAVEIETQVATALRSTHPDVRVLHMSGHAFDVLERRGIDPSAWTVLRKPVSAREMAQHVRVLLDGV